MAFVLRQERSHCSPGCGCDTMTRDEIVKYGVSDFSYLAFIQQYRSIGSAGILFKYPSQPTQNFGPHWALDGNP